MKISELLVYVSYFPALTIDISARSPSDEFEVMLLSPETYLEEISSTGVNHGFGISDWGTSACLFGIIPSRETV